MPAPYAGISQFKTVPAVLAWLRVVKRTPRNWQTHRLERGYNIQRWSDMPPLEA